MLDLFGNHIVGFPTRRLNYEPRHDEIIIIMSLFKEDDIFST